MRIAFEKVMPRDGSSFALLDRQAPAFDGSFHVHPELEITLIESSSGRRVVGDAIDAFQPGDLVLLGDNLPHQYLGDDAGRATPARAKVVQFRRDFLGAAFLAAPELRPVRDLVARSARGLAFSPATVDAARPKIAGIFTAVGLARLLGLLELLALLAGDAEARPIASEGYHAGLDSREGETVDRALRFMDAHLDQPISHADLCRHLATTPATCNRLFRKSLRRSFKAMLLEMRISRACRLLLATDRSVIDIAEASGFPNLSNFNRRFRILKSTTPRGFRAAAKHRIAPGA
jgi:AraC-like DNA-binding protein